MNTRDRIILAWELETDILDRKTIFERANTTDIHELRLEVDAGRIRRDGDEYGLLPPGVDKFYRLRALQDMLNG